MRGSRASPETSHHRSRRGPNCISWLLAQPFWPTKTISSAERRSIVRHRVLGDGQSSTPEDPDAEKPPTESCDQFIAELLRSVRGEDIVDDIVREPGFLKWKRTRRAGG